ncbi:hypothetical protein A9Q86_00815 [Flavobacteriales bacterium 33_180_T64]|nr:hypothetical protein A9Q86_00815 [Flavobacteriales bacterium 33_180_T64]
MSKDRIKIQWLTKSSAMLAYFENTKNIQFTGGTLYEIDAINAIKKKYNVTLNTHYVKHENFIKYYLKQHKRTIDADICVADPYVLACNKLDKNKFNIAMIHHIDENLAKQSILGKWFLKQLLKQLKEVDLVVVVSQFWKTYLEEKQIKNIEIIYNSYEDKDYQFGVSKIDNLKNKLQLDRNKPTIYLGKYSKGKGVEEILRHLDHSKYNLVVSGKNTPQNSAVKSIYLPKNEFPLLLEMADVVLAMSTMPEGWNRIAHESLLMKTPVIGSGTGGMGELLQRSGQKIVTDYSQLDKEIMCCIEEKKKRGELGYSFVKQFDMRYFEKRWLEVIETFDDKSKNRN